ncbi:Radial spoke head protein 3 like protein [Myotis brandtii]|uniref:Radial spoke head protein 3 like protein n=1 Tax=Myotis brandtii TaxID=109478 RepID=S7PTS0_MYOBR|nr:Radial spoke head protein 3 like protein [Myotis brandtii]
MLLVGHPPDEPLPFGNIMYDRRVIRGNTYALHTEPQRGQAIDEHLQKAQETKKRAAAKKRAQEQLRPRTPEPVEGRKHVDVQTELYLEEIADRIIEADMECQTDAFLDKPPTPLFIPAKTGQDVATQILEGEERRKQQQWEVMHKHKETSQKIAARAFSQRYLADLLPSVFDSLKEGGYFFDPVERDIELGFLPWLMNEVDKTMEHSMVGRTVLDMLIREVVERRLNTYEQKEDKHRFLKPEDGPGGPGPTRDPTTGDEFQEQRLLASTDAPYEKLIEEEEEEEDPLGLRRSLGREEQFQGRESWEG